jgi:hypothetical protein
VGGGLVMIVVCMQESGILQWCDHLTSQKVFYFRSNFFHLFSSRDSSRFGGILLCTYATLPSVIPWHVFAQPHWI